MLFLINQLYKLILNIVYFFSCCVPKNKNVWLFGAWQGEKFSDNPLFIYKYTLKQKEIKAFWIVKNKNLYRIMSADGYPVAYAKSLIGIWLQLRAGAIIFTHSHWSEFYACCIGHKTKRIQAWHGAPLKKIGYDDYYARKSTLRTNIGRCIFKYLDDKCDLIFATGESDKKIFEGAFNVLPEDVVITGYPRNDVFSLDVKKTAVKASKLLYMPTFRGQPGSEFPLLTADFFDHAAINSKLTINNTHLYIKLHPVQKLNDETINLIGGLSNVHLLEDRRDIYSFILDFDALITDYSSIFFDFLLSGRPIYMLPIDIVTYLQKERDFYYDYYRISPSKPMMSWDKLIDYIFLQQYPVERHHSLVRKVHFYLDANSTQRAYQAILAKMNKDQD